MDIRPIMDIRHHHHARSPRALLTLVVLCAIPGLVGFVLLAAQAQPAGAVPASATPGQGPALQIDRAVSAATTPPGTTITHTLTLSATRATTVVLTETLPIGLSNLQSTAPITYDHQRHQFYYSALVQPGQPLTLAYRARVEPTVAPGTILTSMTEASGGDTLIDAAGTVAILDPTVTNTLVLVYASGDNNLGESTLALLNRLELAASNPHATVLMLLDGPVQGDALVYRVQPDADTTCPSAQNPTCNGRYRMGQNLWTWGENVAHTDSLATFVQGGLLAYPNARQTVLVLMGHGSGWWANPEPPHSPHLSGLIPQPRGHGRKPGGLLLDETAADSLSTRELGAALRQSTAVVSRPLDLVYLDACLMATAEVAYELRESAAYLLASENVNWTALPYDDHIEAIGSDTDARALGLAWIDHEQDVLDASYPYTYSLIDLAAMEDVRDAIGDLAEALEDRLPHDAATIARAFAKSAHFDSNGDLRIDPETDNLVDLGSFARQAQQEFSDDSAIARASTEVVDALAAAVVETRYNTSAPWLFHEWAWDDLGGLSIYAPLHEDDWKRPFWQRTSIAQQGAGAWQDLLDAYWDDAPAPPPCVAEDCPPAPHPLVPDVTNELYANDYDFWIVPDVVQVGQPVEMGLFVHRQGGKAVYEQVPVHFVRDTPTGPVLGTSTVPVLDPGSDTDSTIPLSITFATTGVYTLYAVIDPLNAYTEDIERNNIIRGKITVVPAAADQTAPVVAHLQVNQGAPTTSARPVTLTVGLADTGLAAATPQADVQAINITEFLYNQHASRWVPVQRSGWLPANETSTYPWQLQPFDGMRYFLVTARDQAGNISGHPAFSLINYQPGRKAVASGQRQVFRYTVEAGQRVRVDLEVLQGDADLYVWSSDPQASAYVSNRASGDEQVIVPAADVVPGIYQIEIYGYARAEYRLHVALDQPGAPGAAAHTHAHSRAAIAGVASSKEPLTLPLLPVASLPVEPVALTSTVYLPFIQR